MYQPLLLCTKQSCKNALFLLLTWGPWPRGKVGQNLKRFPNSHACKWRGWASLITDLLKKKKKKIGNDFWGGTIWEKMYFRRCRFISSRANFKKIKQLSLKVAVLLEGTNIFFRHLPWWHYHGIWWQRCVGLIFVVPNNKPGCSPISVHSSELNTELHCTVNPLL